MKPGRQPLTPLQQQIHDVLRIPWFQKPSMEVIIEGFWSRVDRSGGDDACWLWQGPPATTGYGQLMVQGQHWNTHVFAYCITHFGIPAGLHLDHLCHNTDTSCSGGRGCLHRRCCNPGHLDPTSPRRNRERADEPRMRGAAKTHCNHGHVLDGVLVRRSGSRAGAVHRYCLTCNRERAAARKRKS